MSGLGYFWLVWHLCVMKHASHASHSVSLHKIAGGLHPVSPKSTLIAK